MVLESTMVCVDNSEYMRNGDFLPTRLQAQQDTVNIVCHSETLSNPENNAGLITLANDREVRTTLTPDTGRILSKLHTVQPKGKITFCTGICVAHLALKHPQGKNHKMRITAFVGSPVEDSEKKLVKLAKRLKKEKVNADIINFGEEELRVSVEEQRQPQEEEAWWAAAASAAEVGIATTGAEDSDDALLKMTISQQEFGRTGLPDLSSMTEEEQNAYAMQMSLQGAESGQAESADIDASSAMDTSEPAKEEDDCDLMQDPEFLQSVRENLPGVDPNNEAI
ncbi:26S proteasome non-ATPase regulatory subunit 4-like isoform 2-T2 [Megaptera novaeangliae]